MNCKPGDLAIYKGTNRDFYGCVVTVVGPAPPTATHLSRFLAPWWAIAPALGPFKHAADSVLQPIRPGDVTDEEVRELFAPKQPEVA